MFIGHGAYLGDKVVNINKPKISRVTPLVIKPDEPFNIIGLFAENETTFTMNKNMTLDILGWNTLPSGLASAQVSIPVGSKLSSTPVEIIATTQGKITDPYFVDVKLQNFKNGIIV